LRAGPRDHGCGASGRAAALLRRVRVLAALQEEAVPAASALLRQSVRVPDARPAVHAAGGTGQGREGGDRRRAPPRAAGLARRMGGAAERAARPHLLGVRVSLVLSFPAHRAGADAPTCFLALPGRYKRPGGWRWTSHSPTGSGPEGSSPNERGSGRSSASHPARLFIARCAVIATDPHLIPPPFRGRKEIADHLLPPPESGRVGVGPGNEVTPVSMNDAATPSAPYRVLARKYRPSTFAD